MSFTKNFTNTPRWLFRTIVSTSSEKLKIKATNKYGEEFYKECVLFRDVDSGIVFQTTFAKEVRGRAS